ncbi:MAG: UV DNA damage repair endonuclease UvsE [Bacilli bacterium]|nr:UV DNA damage repair endonuclease UvsE [Bacilli bacterium]
MINRIGYACLTVGIKDNYKTIRKDNITEEKLYNIIEHNLNLLEKQINYNNEHNIRMFRISSDIIPFGSSNLNKLEWDKLFEDKLTEIGEKIKQYNIRVSMHPGQYTVLNSPNKLVLENSIKDLEYHTKFLMSLNTNSSSKIILHIGGVYKDKEESKKRFIESYNRLNQNIKDRLVIENDDKSYNIKDVLEISQKANIPVVYDNLHNKINNSDNNSDYYWIKKVKETWKDKDGVQKIHYSQQAIDKRKGSHSETIDLTIFNEFKANLKNIKVDIMLEVKDKDISAIKCILNKGE